MSIKRRANHQVHYLSSLLLLIIASLPITSVNAQFDLPGTDIWRVQLHENRLGNYELDPNGSPEQLTNHPGYDNQPSFSADGQWLYFTRGDESGYTDIYQLNLLEPHTAAAPVSATSLSEFSPQRQTWSGKPSLFMVQVQTNGEQWLVSMDLSTKKVSRVNDAAAVGYFARYEGGIFQFIVSDPIYAEIRPEGTTKPIKIAENIGRGISASLPVDSNSKSGRTVLYTQLKDNNALITEWDTKTGVKQQLTSIPEAVQDFALDANGAVWVGSGSKLYRWHREDPEWKLMGDLSHWGIKEISRIDIHQSNLALVANESPRQ